MSGVQVKGFPLMLGAVFFISTCIKVLLIPAYRSTDFEVHRNWLAITHSLPLSQWYYDSTSQWTLDYPPLFAWFEWLLSLAAAQVDPLMVRIQSTPYASPNCILYQRFTVIVSDLTLFYALLQYHSYQESRSLHQHPLLIIRKSLVVSLLVLLNYGLIIVDHIHFQYNGFLLGILLLSVVRVMQGRLLEGGFLFAVLLNLKHIFLYMAPAYFLYLLKHYCFSPPTHGDHASSVSYCLPHNFIKLGATVAGVFLVSFGPFLWLGQLGQVLSRLFPFKRGLCHAYWAPNLWALYSFTDMLIFAIAQRLGLLSGSCDADSGSCGGMTSGLVGEMTFKVLPNIPPWVTVVVTVLTMLPGLVRVWFRETPSSHSFLKLLILCAYSSFLFGWHVHEKAVLLITIPMSLLAVEDIKFTRVFIFLSMASHVSLFPLLHQPAETTVKLSLFVMCTCMTFLSFGLLPCFPPLLSHRASSGLSQAADTPAPADSEPPLPGIQAEKLAHLSHSSLDIALLVSPAQTVYVLVLLVVQVYCLFVHGFGPMKRLEFLPLVLTSVSCAIAVLLSWGKFMHLSFAT